MAPAQGPHPPATMTVGCRTWVLGASLPLEMGVEWAAAGFPGNSSRPHGGQATRERQDSVRYRGVPRGPRIVWESPTNLLLGSPWHGTPKKEGTENARAAIERRGAGSQRQEDGSGPAGPASRLGGGIRAGRLAGLERAQAPAARPRPSPDSTGAPAPTMAVLLRLGPTSATHTGLMHPGWSRG